MFYCAREIWHEPDAIIVVNQSSCSVFMGRCVWLHRSDVRSVVSNRVRWIPRTPTSETPCLSGGCNSCPGCGGTRAAGCVLLCCSQTGGTLWSRSSGCLRSAGGSHIVIDSKSNTTPRRRLVNSWTRATCEARLAGAFISVNMVIDTPALICGSPGLFPKVLTTDEVGESKEEMQSWLVDGWNREERRRREGTKGDNGSVKHRPNRDHDRGLSFRTAAWNGCTPVFHGWKLGDILKGDLIWRMISTH